MKNNLTFSFSDIQMPLYERFAKAVDYLIVNKAVKNKKTFYESIGMKKGRFDYLYRDPEAQELKFEEKQALSANYPEIAWESYVLGDGEEMLSEKVVTMAEPGLEYKSKAWYQQQLVEIVSGVSKLDKTRQLEILRAAYVEQSQELTEAKDKLLKAKEISESSLLDELKRMIKK